MGLFDGNFSFSDPNSLALLGMIAGLGQASAPSRLPVGWGQVFGSLAGGAMQGAAAGQEAQLKQQATTSAALNNQKAFDQIRFLSQALGAKPPSMEDVRSGKYQGLISSLPGGTPVTTPSQPAPAAQIGAPPPVEPPLALPEASKAQIAHEPIEGGPPLLKPQVVASIGQPGPGAPGWPGGTPPVQMAQAGPPASDAAQAAAAQPQAAAQAPSDMQKSLTNAMFKSYLGYQLTPVEQNLLSASMAPQGSMQQRLANAAASKAAGITPFLGGERPGVPIRAYNPATGGYDIVAQNPALERGQMLGANGQVSVPPGFLPTLGQIKGMEAWAGVPAKLYESEQTPKPLGPNETLVVPGQLNAPAAAAPPGAPPGAQAAAPGQPQPGQPAGQPGVLRQGISPLYQQGVDKAVTADQDRLSKELQPQVDKANEQMATAQLINDLLPRVATGWSAETKLDAARVMKGFGVSDDLVKQFLGTNAAAGDVLNKMFLAQTAQAVRVMGAREPGSVISLFGKAYPRLETQANATKLLENVLTMQGQRAHDEFAMAQQQHGQALEGLRTGQPYAPLSKFEAEFNAGPHASTNYLKAAQAMAADNSAWKGLKPEDIDQVVALIPSGKQFTAPDGTLRVKP